MQDKSGLKYQFPDEVQRILPLHRVVGSIRRRGLAGYTEDLCQELVIAIQAAQARGVDVDIGYAFAILRNLIRKLYRKIETERIHLGRYGKQCNLKPDFPNPHEAVTRIEQHNRALDLLKRWPKQDQTIFVLYAIERFTFQKIADMLHRPETTVRLKYHEIVKGIGRLMQNDSDVNRGV